MAWAPVEGFAVLATFCLCWCGAFACVDGGLSWRGLAPKDTLYARHWSFHSLFDNFPCRCKAPMAWINMEGHVLPDLFDYVDILRYRYVAV